VRSFGGARGGGGWGRVFVRMSGLSEGGDGVMGFCYLVVRNTVAKDKSILKGI
jgi:hypothetical protein